MKRLYHMKESLIACVESQIANNLAGVDTKELGEAIDMIKDLEEAIYYCTITKAMKENDDEENEGKHSKHQQQPMYQGNNSMYYPPMYNDGSMYNMGSMYNDGNMYANGTNNNSNVRNYRDMSMGNNHMMKDHREGSSPMYRRMYMEGKEQKHDQAKIMKELEDYMHELTNDIMEMIEEATPEEKQLLRQKITTLATKIK